MRKLAFIIAIIALSTPLTGCYTLAVGAAGAGAGYIVKDKEEKGEIELSY